MSGTFETSGILFCNPEEQHATYPFGNATATQSSPVEGFAEQEAGGDSGEDKYAEADAPKYTGHMLTMVDRTNSASFVTTIHDNS